MALSVNKLWCNPRRQNDNVGFLHHTEHPAQKLPAIY